MRKQDIHDFISYGNAKKAVETADFLLTEGIYVIAFCYPVVPKGKARIRVQLSAAHTKEQIEKAVHALSTQGKIYKRYRFYRLK